MLCGWEIKAGMIRSFHAWIKHVVGMCEPLLTHATSDSHRDKQHQLLFNFWSFMLSFMYWLSKVA